MEPSRVFTLFSMFQFQLGAIKRPRSTWSDFFRSEFQFQLGAIKSIIPEIKKKLRDLFQFQLGAIKSCCVLFVQAN